jgi:hypothetical protein
VESKRPAAFDVEHLVFDLAGVNRLAAYRARLTTSGSAPKLRNRVLRQTSFVDFLSGPSAQFPFKHVSLVEHGYSPE